MTSKRPWIALLAIPVCLISVLIIGAQRSHPANAGGVIDPTCVSASPCIEYDNNGTGTGIRGVSLSGNGLVGFTKVNSTSATNGREGVFGNDLSTSGSFNSGVRGLSVRGTGVFGNSTSGVGVSGQSTSGPGLSGTSSSGDGVDGYGNTGVLGSGSNIGVLGSSSGTGVQGNSSGRFGTGVSGVANASGTGVSGNSTNGTGVYGQSTSGVAVVGAQFATSSGYTIFQGLALDIDRSVVSVFTVDNSGNVQISGTIKTNGSCRLGCAKPAAPGYHVVSYAPTESLPTMEDTGEAQLVNGAAYVHIDPAFSNVIDKTANYVVLITPEGDSRGLYVTQKSAAGFTVHENQNGRSTLAFGYRIVAKPYGSTEARLPMVYMPKGQPHRPSGLRPGQFHG